MIADLHCDLLSYFQDSPSPDPYNRNDIGCNLIALETGNVKLQIMAIFALTQNGSSKIGLDQSLIFKKLPQKYPNNFTHLNNNLVLKSENKKTGLIAAIENASCFCEENEPLDNGLKRLQKIIDNTSKLAYISLTHASENRFGGGNSSSVGLKKDGEKLIDYLIGKKIAIDFAHTSDALAEDILNYFSKQNIEIPILASHSNFRAIYNHKRNLPDEIAREIILKKGLIGINFLRAFLNDNNPNAIYDHINHAYKLGGEQSLCFGADFFYCDSHPDQSRHPFFFEGLNDSSCYKNIIDELSKTFSPNQINLISRTNALNFLKRLWN